MKSPKHDIQFTYSNGEYKIFQNSIFIRIVHVNLLGPAKVYDLFELLKKENPELFL